MRSGSGCVAPIRPTPAARICGSALPQRRASSWSGCPDELRSSGCAEATKPLRCARIKIGARTRAPISNRPLSSVTANDGGRPEGRHHRAGDRSAVVVGDDPEEHTTGAPVARLGVFGSGRTLRPLPPRVIRTPTTDAVTIWMCLHGVSEAAVPQESVYARSGPMSADREIHVPRQRLARPACP